MFTERTSLGLDVHARSIKAAAIDTLTGELIERTMPSDAGEVMALVAGLRAGHGDVKVTYEAGPTGFELARALAEEGIACQVAAPSKLLRPSGERVKTDRRDAILLARLARNDDIVAVRVPTRSQEGARDLVRSRADARGDLMTARHRLSKMLLRRGIVYDGARTWTRIHDAWLRRVRRDHVIGMGPSAPAPLTTPVLRARWCTPPHAATGLMRPSPVSPDDGGPRPHRQASGLPSPCQP